MKRYVSQETVVFFWRGGKRGLGGGGGGGGVVRRDGKLPDLVLSTELKN